MMAYSMNKSLKLMCVVYMTFGAFILDDGATNSS